eukprot:GHVU01143642.1.p1 GENE.GHVU01143642.1~~GHVU01143642.1.p1  ORF type:complete len:182 (-),score=5.41 GHVU01143642.1:793-1338(-)
MEIEGRSFRCGARPRQCRLSRSMKAKTSVLLSVAFLLSTGTAIQISPAHYQGSCPAIEAPSDAGLKKEASFAQLSRTFGRKRKEKQVGVGKQKNTASRDVNQTPWRFDQKGLCLAYQCGRVSQQGKFYSTSSRQRDPNTTGIGAGIIQCDGCHGQPNIGPLGVDKFCTPISFGGDFVPPRS